MISMVKLIIIAAICAMVLGFVFFGIFSAGIFRQVNNRRKMNEAAPRISVPARVVTKRTEVSGTHSHIHNHSHTSTYYYVTFELGSRDRVELPMYGHEYGMLIEGDQGILTFKGDEFIDFRRN
jgi:hypothetical protein